MDTIQKAPFFMSKVPENSDPATEMAIAACRLYAEDPAAAAKLFMRAAAAGNENAKVAAARMFIDGDGVDFDPRRALQLLSEVCSSECEENFHLAPLLCRLAERFDPGCRSLRRRGELSHTPDLSRHSP